MDDILLDSKYTTSTLNDKQIELAFKALIEIADYIADECKDAETVSKVQDILKSLQVEIRRLLSNE